MDYEYIVYTPMLDLSSFLAEVDSMIDILKRNNITTIQMCFGWSWGDWQSFSTDVHEIMNEIRKAEELQDNKFGEQDVYINIKDLETQILFCHEADLHIEFNKTNAVIRDVLDSWKGKGLVHCVRKNKRDIEFEDLPL